MRAQNFPTNKSNTAKTAFVHDFVSCTNLSGGNVSKEIRTPSHLCRLNQENGSNRVRPDILRLKNIENYYISVSTNKFDSAKYDKKKYV